MLHAFPGFLESDDFVPSTNVASMESASLEAPGGSGVGVLSGYAFYMRQPSICAHLPCSSPGVNLEGTCAVMSCSYIVLKCWGIDGRGVPPR
jgi:hypothetical protein